MPPLSTGDASFVEDDLLNRSEEHILIESFLERAPFNKLCCDGMAVGVASVIEHIDPFAPSHLTGPLFYCPLFPTTWSHLYALDESLCDLRGPLLYIPRGHT